VKTDTLIKSEGMKILTEHLGKVEAERFIALIIREPFDYTRWQVNLWQDRTVKEVSEAAMNYRKSLQY